MYRKGVRLWGAGLVILGSLLILMELLPVVGGAILPNPGSPQANLVHGVVVNNTGFNAYGLALSFTQGVVVPLTQGYCAISCTYSLNNSWQNISKPIGLAASLSSGITWVNGTGSCGTVACPGGTLTCDGVGYTLSPAQSTQVAVPCFLAALSWPSGTFQGPGGLQTLNYTVTRILTYVTATRTLWTAAGLTATESPTITAPTSNYWTHSPTNWMVRSASWVLPFPNDTWDYSSVVLKQLPNQTPISPATYTVFSQYALVQWTGGFPTTVGQNTTLQFLLSITTVSGPATTKAAKLSNQSYPIGPAIQLSVITLPLGNETTGPGGYEQFTVTWTNPYSSAYSGEFNLAQNGLATTAQLNLTANGQVIPSYDYTLNGAAVLVQSGVVNVGNGSSVTFDLSYLPTSSWTFFSPVAYLNNYPITPVLIASFVIETTAGLVVAIQPRIGLGKATIDDIVGILVVAGLLIMWLVVR